MQAFGFFFLLGKWINGCCRVKARHAGAGERGGGGGRGGDGQRNKTNNQKVLGRQSKRKNQVVGKSKGVFDGVRGVVEKVIGKSLFYPLHLVKS